MTDDQNSQNMDAFEAALTSGAPDESLETLAEAQLEAQEAQVAVAEVEAEEEDPNAEFLVHTARHTMGVVS